MAPELFGDDDSYDYAVDVFAWAILVYAMFAKGESLAKLFDDGRIPRTSQAMMKKIRVGTRYRHLPEIPPAWWSLITQCWSYVPSSRPSIASIVDVMTSNPAAYMFPGTNEQQLREYVRTIQ
jgi:hypothetical protein